MRGYHVTRSQSQQAPGPCHCGPEDFDALRDFIPPAQDHAGHGVHVYHPPVAAHDLALRRVPSYGGGTFPRSHPGTPGPGHFGHAPKKSGRGQTEQERQLEGFHTLQYPRATSGGQQRQQRPESPGRIRNLVHSVQRLFAKSQSLEAPPQKREQSQAPPRNPAHHRRGPRNPAHRRSKSHDRCRSRDSRHRGRNGGWWSSDDNLDSDSGYLQSSRGRRVATSGHAHLEGPFQDLTLRGVRAPGPQGDCMSCVGDPAHAMKMNAWLAMANSQPHDGYPGPAHSKALVPLEPNSKDLQYLKVPSEDCGGVVFQGVSGVPGGVTEIPCRRMRSSSYIRAMGDVESVESDDGPNAAHRNSAASRKGALMAQREALRRSVSMDQRPPTRPSCKQCASAYANSRTLPRNHSCLHMQRGESMSESVFGDFAESQAVDALDLPGSFRARSQSYIRAIQAGVSQEDECLPVFSLSGPQGGAKGAGVFPNRRKLAPPLPPRMSRPQRSLSVQSSTEESSQMRDVFFHSSGQQVLRRPRMHSSSLDGGEEMAGGRSSRAGYYPGAGAGTGRGRGCYQHSNSVESFDWPRGREQVAPMRSRHSSSADNLLETGGDKGRMATLGKSVSLPHNGRSMRVQEERVQDGRKWRPSGTARVDGSHSDSDPESKARRSKQSMEVEGEDKRRARFRRSYSVMSGMMPDSEREELQGRALASNFSTSTFQRHASEPDETRTVHTQGQWVCRDNYRHSNEPRHDPRHTHGRATPFDHAHGRATPSDHVPGRATPSGHAQGRATPSDHAHGRVTPSGHAQGRATPADHSHGRATPSSHGHEQSWGEGRRSRPASARATPTVPTPSSRASPSLRDGELYMRMLQTEVERMEGWCQHFQREAEEKDLPDEALVRIGTAVGCTQALLSQKAQHFFRVCQQSVDPAAHPQPGPQDLAELWDLLQLAVEEVRLKFQDLQRLKDSGWRLHLQEEKSLPPPLPKKPSGGVSGGRVQRGGVSHEPPPLPEKTVTLLDHQQVQDVHGRLLPAKHSAHLTYRQNSATESADGMEIYIPEAQTRF